MLEGIEAVIFDLDGTLVDSMWMWKRIDIEFLRMYGIECPDDVQKGLEGMSFSETAVYFKERFHLAPSTDEIKAIWIDMSIEKYRTEVPFKKGADPFLHLLRERGIRTGIATSNAQEMVDAVLSSLHARDLFDAVTTACEAKHGKPAPDVYLLAAERLGVKPEHCLVFEDVPAGILAGKRAGMKVCAVEDEFSLGMEAEKRSLSDYYIHDYEELL